MNVEQLQKINNLANELKKHNSGMNAQEAVQQAEQTYASQNQNEGQAQTQQKQESSQKIEANQNTKQDLLEQRRFELMLERHTKKYDQQLEEYRNAINKLAEELETVKLKLNSIAAQQPKERQEALPPQPKKEEKKSHPKQGSFSSEDVDIQKMFYFGNT